MQILILSQFFSDDMGLNTINTDNINLDDNNFHEDDPETIIHDRLWVGIININNTNHVKKINAKNYCLLHNSLQNGGIGVCLKMEKKK